MSVLSSAIVVWRYADAPESLRALSPHGGDEDWLAVVPRDLCDPHVIEDWPRPRLTDGTCYDDGRSYDREDGPLPAWMHSGTAFGWCSVSVHPHPDSGAHVIAIGAHA